MNDRTLDHLHDQRARLENDVDMLRRAMELATRFDREDKAAAIEKLIDAATAELDEIEDQIPAEEPYRWGVL